MTDIEQKALALVNEVRADRDRCAVRHISRVMTLGEALCRAIEELEAEKAARAADREQHEAYRQQVSDAVEAATKTAVWAEVERILSPFIIAKPDPLVEAFEQCGIEVTDAAKLRSLLANRGYEWRKIEGEG